MTSSAQALRPIIDISCASEPVRIKTFLFDIGNVLLFFSMEKMYAQILEVTGLEKRDARTLLTDGGFRLRYEAGEHSTVELIDLFRRSSRRAFLDAEFLDAFSDIFTENSAMVPMLAALKRQGHRLVLVSNTSEAHMHFAVPRFECLRLFDAAIFSYEVKALKPEAEFYRAAAAAAQCAPSEAVFIDDLRENCDGAAAAGFRPILFDSQASFDDGLSLLGIELMT